MITTAEGRMVYWSETIYVAKKFDPYVLASILLVY